MSVFELFCFICMCVWLFLDGKFYGCLFVFLEGFDVKVLICNGVIDDDLKV